jgi:UDP-N-acetyl-2-amino-2-deoxyglucuronate dehydrogenase
MLTYPKNLEGSLTILGEKGTVRIGGVAVNEIKEWQFADNPNEGPQELDHSNYQTDNVYGFGHPAFFKNVIEVLRGERKPMTDGRDGIKSLELIEGIYRSAKSGQRVYLPLEM